MAKLYLPTIMRHNAGGHSTLTVPGQTVAAVLGRLVTDFPAVRAQLLDEAGQVCGHVKVFVNGDDISQLQGQDTVLADRDEIHLITAMAGG